MLNQVYATKLSSSQAFEQGKRIPLTLLKVDSHTVTAQKSVAKDGYSSTVVSFGKRIREILSEETFAKDSVVDLATILTPGSTIDVTAVSKGKGFSGVMKRWGFAGGPRTHGQSDRGRAPGSIGRGTTPGRVLPGKHMAGRMGNTATQIKNLRIFSFDKDSGLLKITGLIPGGRNALATITVTKTAETK